MAIAVIAGVTVGAVISLLFTPDRGSETRRGITGKALALGTSLKGLFAPSKTIT
ncbi:YtxH domain-containing protein [Pedobacter panaciterrae]|nr:YtxH domain-containing protein [Pedobacter panaciterrae]